MPRRIAVQLAGQVQAAAGSLDLLPPEVLDKCLVLHERTAVVTAAAALAAAMDGVQLSVNSSSSSNGNSSATAKALRATCRWLRDHVDASLQRLSLGGPVKLKADWRKASRGSTQRQQRQERRNEQLAVQRALLGLLQRTPRVAQLVLRSHLHWVSLADIMAAGGQPLRQRLTHLHLQGRHAFTSLQPLASLPELRVLHLDDHHSITDLAPLTSCTALGELLLSCSPATSLSPLAAMLQLRSLKFFQHWDMTTPDLAPLRACTCLTELYLSGCNDIICEDLEPLMNVVSLERLSLAGCGWLQDLGPLSGLTRLQHVDVSECPFDDLQPIAQPTLVGLVATDRHFSFSLAPLRNCPKLRVLNVSRSREVQGFQHLSRLTSLQSVMASHCDSLDSLTCFSGSMPGLLALEASYTGVTDIQALATAPQLMLLALDYCDLPSSLSPLASCSSLQVLSLSGTGDDRGLDLAPISCLRSLRYLDVRACQLMSAAGTAPAAALLSLAPRLRELCVCSGMLPAELAAQLASCLLVDDVDVSRGSCVVQERWRRGGVWV